jgi:bacterioferritin (cytochrome b1)
METKYPDLTKGASMHFQSTPFCERSQDHKLSEEQFVERFPDIPYHQIDTLFGDGKITKIDGFHVASSVIMQILRLEGPDGKPVARIVQIAKVGIAPSREETRAKKILKIEQAARYFAAIKNSDEDIVDADTFEPFVKTSDEYAGYLAKMAASIEKFKEDLAAFDAETSATR